MPPNVASRSLRPGPRSRAKPSRGVSMASTALHGAISAGIRRSDKVGQGNDCERDSAVSCVGVSRRGRRRRRRVSSSSSGWRMAMARPISPISPARSGSADLCRRHRRMTARSSKRVERCLSCRSSLLVATQERAAAGLRAPRTTRRVPATCVEALRAGGLPVETGVFQPHGCGARQRWSVTILLDRARRRRSRRALSGRAGAPSIKGELCSDHSHLPRGTFVAALCISVPALAQSRPLVTEDPETVPIGHMLVEAALDFTHRRSIQPRVDRKSLAHRHVRMSFGVGPIAELQIDGGLHDRLNITNRAHRAAVVDAHGSRRRDVDR